MQIILIIFSIIIIISQSASPSHPSSDKGILKPKDEIMGVEELRPGMKGYGKTVFLGTDIETFEVEIIGVLKKYEAESDMILVRLLGDLFEKTGIIAGMSGSPIYINDKLIGAVSYGWSFSKDPIAGVTPIHDMLKVLATKPLLKDHRYKSPSYALNPTAAPNRFGQGKLIPIKAPLMVSGFDSRVFEIMAPEFDMFGLIPIQSGGWSGNIASNDDNDEVLAPGSAITVQLIRGDINASSVGTVTYKDGNNILAFGHPFLQAGDIDFPLSGAYVYTTMANQSMSVKMASATKELGKINQDRKSAIAGVIGEFSSMIPCHIEIEGVQDAIYDFDIVRSNLFTPTLIQMAILSALLATEDQLKERIIKLELAIFIDELKSPITVNNIYYEATPVWFSIYDITQPIMELLDNRFKPVRIEKILLKAQIIDGRKIALIENIKVNKKTVKPGDLVNVSVLLRPYMSNIVEKTINIQIPFDVVPGSKILITACSADFNHYLDMARSTGRYKPANFEQLVDLIKGTESNNEAFVRVLYMGRGITYKGVSFPSLPSSLMYVMSLSNYSGVEQLAEEKVYRIDTEWVIQGNPSIMLIVKEG